MTLDPSAGEPEPATGFVVGPASTASSSLERSGQRRRGRRVSLGQPQRKPVEQDVDRTRRVGTGGRSARGLRRPPAAPPGMIEVAAIAAPSASRCVSRARFGVERLETSGRAHEQPTSVAGTSLLQRDLAAQEVDAGALELVERPRLDCDQQSERRVERAGVALRRGSREQALRTASGFGRQHRGALEERGGRRQAPARLRSAGRALELPRDAPRRARARPAPGARRGGRDRSPDRSPPPARGARPVAPEATPTGRPPSAPADGETAPARRTRAGPPRPPASPPRCGFRVARLLATPATARPPDRPPRAAAAAGSRPEARRAAAGSSPRSLRESGTAPGSPNPPASSAGVTPRSQLQQRQRVAARLADDLVTHPRVQRRRRAPTPAARARRPRASPSTTSSGNPARSSLGARAANTSPTDSASRRRATNARTCADARSSHCSSSTRQISGRSSATSESRLRTARPTKKRSGAGPGLTPNAVRSASRCGTGRRFEAIEHRRQQLMQPGERELHLRLDPHGARHRQPDACSTTYSNSAVLPTPGSPRTTSTRLSPAEQPRSADQARRTRRGGPLALSRLLGWGIVAICGPPTLHRAPSGDDYPLMEACVPRSSL